MPALKSVKFYPANLSGATHLPALCATLKTASFKLSSNLDFATQKVVQKLNVIQIIETILEIRLGW